MQIVRLIISVILLALLCQPVQAQFLKKLKRAVDDAIVTPNERRESCEYATPSGTSGVIFSEDFESGKLGSMWARRPNEHSFIDVVDYIQDVQKVPYEGDYALAMGVQSGIRTGTPIVNAVDLCLNLSGQTDMTLHFMIRDQLDANTPEDAILFSDNGGEDFKTVLRLQPFSWSDNIYGMITIDVAKAAEQVQLSLNDRFVIRFQQSGTQDFAGNRPYSADGFLIDNVVLRGRPEYARVPFRDGFENGTLGNHWRVSDPFRGGETAPELSAQWNFVQPVQRLADVPPIPRTGDYSLALGRPMGTGGSNPELVSSADLHLNLENKEEASLSFYLRQEIDEPGEYDGVYLSDDAGEHFTKALNFPYDSRNPKKYAKIELDLARRSSELGLSLTQTFIVRIQQAGSHDFAGNQSYFTDGIFIDDLVVDAPLSPIEQITAQVDSDYRQWRQQGRYEKTEDYEARISAGEEAARDSLTQIAVGRLAATMIDFTAIVSEYDADTEVFTLTVDHLLPFALPVPIGEAEEFDLNLASLEVRNAAYSLGDGDLLTLVSAEITNPANGKTYTVRRSTP